LDQYLKNYQQLQLIKQKLEDDLGGIRAVNSDLQSNAASLQESLKQKQADLERQRQEAEQLRLRMLQHSETGNTMENEFQLLQEQLNKEVQNLNQYREQKELMSKELEKLIEEKQAIQE
jgi:hypothetical protein